MIWPLANSYTQLKTSVPLVTKWRGRGAEEPDVSLLVLLI